MKRYPQCLLGTCCVPCHAPQTKPSVIPMNPKKTSRRRFLTSTAAGISTITLRWPTSTAHADTTPRRPVQFGVIADIHKGVIHDADQRLTAFVDAMQQAEPDFVIQLGDFCLPIPENDGFMDVWQRLEMPRHHVLGNHDMDGDGKIRPDRTYAFSREETMEYWGMKSRYYSFDAGGVHFVILDGNDQGPGQQPYYRYIADDQADWLARDLAKTELVCVLFIHQSLEREPGGVENQAKIRAVLEAANNADGRQKVVACFTAHHHRDYVREINGIYYPQINSASYYWLGGDYLQVRYSEEINEKYPYLKYTVPYRDPLFALVRIDAARGEITIKGRKSEFVGPSPWDLGADRAEMEEHSLVPTISDRTFVLET